jgi:glycosyltransferase involved in cell wall biosynthesis
MKSTLETLVILTPGFPVNEDDYGCLPPQQLFVKTLKEICPDLNILVLAFHYPFKAREYLWNGIPVIALGGKNKGKINRLLTWIKAWLHLNKIKNDYAITGLLSFWFGECALVGHYFSKRNGLLHYSWILGQDAKKGNKYFAWIKPKAESLIALSDFLVKEVKKNYGISPVHVIPVGIDKRLFAGLPPKRDIDVLGAGSLIPLKQYHLFCEVLSVIKKHLPGVTAIICGKGPELEKLKRQVVEANLESNVSFAGEVSQADLFVLMQRSKILLHPSSYEGFGSVIAEALYAGAHVVSFCKPMEVNFAHHHVVTNVDEMNHAVLSLLKNDKKSHQRVPMYPIRLVARNLICLYAQ